MSRTLYLAAPGLLAQGQQVQDKCHDSRPMKLWRTPLDVEKFSAPHGEMRILIARCKGCELCVRYCPCDVLEMSEDVNAKGYHPPRAKNPDQCVACRLCELLCPEFCIYVVEDKVKSDDE